MNSIKNKNNMYEFAVLHSDFKTMNELLDSGVSPNLFFIHNKTDILLESMLKGKPHMVEKSLRLGFKLKSCFFYMHHAIRTNNFRIVKAISSAYLEQNRNINEIDNHGNNLWHAAAEVEDVLDKQIVNFILKEKINFLHLNNENINPIDYIFKFKKYTPYYLVDIFKENNNLLYFDNFLKESPIDILFKLKESKSWLNDVRNKEVIDFLNSLKIDNENDIKKNII